MKNKKASRNLSAGFARSVERFPMNPALDVNDTQCSYEQLSRMAACLSGKIKDVKAETDQPLITLLAYRSAAAYAGILGILGAGCAYVPLHPDFPAERNLQMLELSKANLMIVSKECQEALDKLLKITKRNMKFILVGIDKSNQYIKDYPEHRFILIRDLKALDENRLDIKEAGTDDIAYLLFTSGSTGEPKGVPVRHSNVRSYIKFMTGNYDFHENDRFSQMHDMTFDLSVHDMFLAWESGGCLCVPTKQDKLFPLDFIQRQEISAWLSVPSIGAILDKYQRLEPGVFPDLRYSFFCGEALSFNIAEKWQKAAPNSRVINIYGPTEATIAIARYEWDRGNPPSKSTNGIVPIGHIYQSQKGRVIRRDGQFSGMGEEGELLLSGSQVTKGYWNNPQKTKEQYVSFPDTGDVLWYKTGDLVRLGEDGNLYYLGRMDNQIQILGNRVELGEIDHVLREASGVETAASVAWPVHEGSANGVVGFISGLRKSHEEIILNYCRNRLPHYMVPTRMVFLDDMPLNVNGKIDRKQLKQLLEEGKNDR